MRVTDDEGAATCESLFREYGEWSARYLANDYGIVLSEDELEEVHATFRLEQPALFGPRGRLYLVEVDSTPTRVGALKPIGPYVCEIKRMFVRPACRRMGVARTILERLLTDARELGYRTARLETMTYMREAHELTSLDFHLLMLILANQPGRLFRQKGSRPTNDGRRCKRETYGFADWLHVSRTTANQSINRLNAVGGVSIGASHNASEWNALKFLGRDGTYLSTAEASELLDNVYEER